MQMSCIVQFLFIVVHPQARPNGIEFVLYSCQLKQPASRGATVASGPFTAVKSELTRELFTFCIALLFSCTGVPKF